jgi:hypothetical protein
MTSDRQSTIAQTPIQINYLLAQFISHLTLTYDSTIFGVIESNM